MSNNDENSYERPDDVSGLEFAADVLTDIGAGLINGAIFVVKAPFNVARYLWQSPYYIHNEVRGRQLDDEIYMTCSMALYGNEPYKSQALADLEKRSLSTDPKVLKQMMRLFKNSKP